jgi:hypothetical protein
MKKSLFFTLTSVLMIAVITSTALGDQISWSNASGGNWNTGSNWAGGIVPGASDTALITLDGTYTVTLDTDPSVAGITLGGSSGRQSFTMTSRTLTVNGPFTINTNGKVTTSSSTINGTGNMLVSDTLALTNTTIDLPIQNSGVITIQATNNFNQTYSSDVGSTLLLTYISNYGSNLVMANGFTNNGLIDLVATHSQTGVVITCTNGPLVNSTTGRIDARSVTGGQFILAELDNQGIFDIQYPLTLNSASANHTNSGTINVTGGNFVITQSGTNPSFTNTGTMVIDNGFILDINGGAFNYPSGGISGMGTLDFNAATITWVPVINWAGSLIINTSTLTISDSLLIHNHTPVFSSTINGTGIILVSDTLALTLSTIDVPIQNSGVITIQATNNFNQPFVSDIGSTLLLTYTSNYGSNLVMANGLTNNGLIDLVATHSQTGVVITSTNGPLVNSPTGTISARSTTGGQFILAELDNQGTIDIEYPLYLDSASANHTNSGTINVTGGNVTIAQSGTTPSFTNTGTMVIDSGLVLDVNGGAFNYPSGSISGMGTLDFSAATITWVPVANWAGSLIINTSTLTISDSLLIHNHTPVFSSTINGTGTILVTDTLALTGATIDVPVQNSGVITIQSANNFNQSFISDIGSTLLLTYISNYGSNLVMADGFTNNGLIDLVATQFQTGVVITCTDGPLVNSPTGTIFAHSATGGQIIYAELDNQGTIDIEYPIYLDSASANHTNSGTINVTGGNVTIAQSGTTPGFTNICQAVLQVSPMQVLSARVCLPGY